MKLTQATKNWLIENAGVSKDASDEEFQQAAAAALVSGKLDHAKYAELQKSPESNSADKLVAGIVAGVSGAISKALEEKFGNSAEPKASVQTADQIVKSAGATAGGPVAGGTGTVGGGDGEGAAAKAIADGAGKSAPRLISVKEMYRTNRSDLTYQKDGKHPALAGRAVTSFGGRQMYEGSELDKAICGAWFKRMVQAGGVSQFGTPPWLRMTDHDRELIKYAAHETNFTGLIGGEWEDKGASKVDNRRLAQGEVKTLLDDATSGGLEIVPIVFDDMIITYPLLFGELFPLVRLVDIARGRRIEGASVNNVTFTSGIAEGTAITPLTTTAFIAAFDTTIYNAVGAIELGLDFQADSPVAIGDMVIESYGRAALNWLDIQIALGDGTTEPQGIMNASGVTDTDWGADAATVSDYEGLLFGVPKEYREASMRSRQVFCANETTYRRARGISVGVDDQRRVFGMDHEEYRLLGHPYKIVQSMGNGEVFFADLSRYRMYRRLGLGIRVELGGRELALKNQALIVARMRFGGKLEDSSAASLTDSAEA